MKNYIKVLLLLTIMSGAVVSCDKDFATIGSDVVGDGHFDLRLDDESFITAYNQRAGAVASNNQPVNPLGIYNNPVFGKTKAHFVTQLSAASVPTFTALPSVVVDDVELYIPYFSNKVDTDSEGMGVYVLDSIYGNVTSTMKLGVYESGYFLRDTDPGNNFNPQVFYSDEYPLISSYKVGSRLNDSANQAENDLFNFDKTEVVTSEPSDDPDNPTVVRRAPGIWMRLNKTFFKNKVFSPEGVSNLNSLNAFNNYFRGLFFEVEENPGQLGALSMIDFSKGVITIKYREQEMTDHDNDPSTPDVPTFVDKKLELNLSGNTVSLLEQTYSPSYEQAISNPDTDFGDPRLFVKGGEGSMVVIDLFGPDSDGNGIPDQLEEIRQNNWLINEANLTFYIDRDAMNGASEPYRVYLYDIKNRTPLVDFTSDGSTNSAKPKFGKIIHGGILEKESSEGRGVRYKVRLTNHLRNLIRRDSTNVKLGLVVTEDFVVSSQSNPLRQVRLREETENGIRAVPMSSVMNPLGTILYGTHPSVPEDKKLKLQIYYTKPN